MRYTDILFRYKVWVSPRPAHTHTRAANIHTTHKGKTKVPMGAAAKPPPPSVLLCAREARAPLCVAVSLCGTSIESIESIISIESVTSIESVESRTSRESIESVESRKSVSSGKQFWARGPPKKWFVSVRTAKKHDFKKSFLSPDSNSSQKVTSNALVDS